MSKAIERPTPPKSVQVFWSSSAKISNRRRDIHVISELAGSMESMIVSQSGLMWPEPVDLTADIEQLREHFDPYSRKSPIRGESSTSEPMTVVICDINFWTKILHLHRQRQPLYRYACIFHSVYRFLTLWMWLRCLEEFISLFQQSRKLMLANHEVTLVQQYGAVALISVPIFLLAGAGT